MKRSAIFVAVLLVALLFGSGLWFARRAPNLSPATQRLFTALQNNDAPAVAEAIVQGADVNARNEAGFTPLVWAVANVKDGIPTPNATAILPLLLDKGANIDAPAVGNESALIVAVKFKKPEAVKILLDRKADMRVKNVEGKTALAFARGYHFAKIAAQLEAAGATQ